MTEPILTGQPCRRNICCCKFCHQSHRRVGKASHNKWASPSPASCTRCNPPATRAARLLHRIINKIISTANFGACFWCLEFQFLYFPGSVRLWAWMDFFSPPLSILTGLSCSPQEGFLFLGASFLSNIDPRGTQRELKSPGTWFRS